MPTETRRIYQTSFSYIFWISMFTSFYGIFLIHQFGFSEGQLRSSFAADGTCVGFTQLVILRALAKRYSEQTLLRYALLLVSTRIALSALMPNAPLFLVFIPLIAVLHTLSLSNIPALVSRSGSPDKQGRRWASMPRPLRLSTDWPRS